MKNYGSKTLNELKKEYKLQQKTAVKEISHNCYESEYENAENVYTVQFDRNGKLLGIWDSDGGKIEKI